MADGTFLDPTASLADQLRALLFPGEVARGFMAEQAAVSIETGFGYLMGRGHEERLKALIEKVDALEQCRLRALQELLDAVDAHRVEADEVAIDDSVRDRNDIDNVLYAKAGRISRAHPFGQPKLPGA